MSISFNNNALECDIVKKGCVAIKRPPFHVKLAIASVKTWQIRYFVLRDETATTCRRLEIFANESDYHDHKTALYQLDLSSVIRLADHSKSKSHPRSLLLVRCCQPPLYIGFDNNAEMQNWKTALELVAFKTSTDSIPGCNKCNPKKEVIKGEPRSPCTSPLPTARKGISRVFSRENDYANVENGYNVIVRPTPASYLHDLMGNYSLHVQDEAILLKDLSSRDIIKKWPLTTVRTISNMDEGSNDLFTLQMELGGRKCPAKCTCRDGFLQFTTQHGEDICKNLKTSLPSIHCTLTQSPNIENARKVRSKSYEKINAISLQAKSTSLTVNSTEITRCRSYNNLVKNAVHSFINSKSKSSEKIHQVNVAPLNHSNSGYLEPIHMASSSRDNLNNVVMPTNGLATPEISQIRRKSGGFQFHLGTLPKLGHSKRKSPPTPLPHPDYIDSLLRTSKYSDSETQSSDSEPDALVPPPLPPRNSNIEDYHKYEYIED